MSKFPVLIILALSSILSACGGGDGNVSAPPVNSAPRAMITVAKTTGYAPLTVEFDGTLSNDSDGSVSTYTWQTGDGASYAGSQISHTYTTLGAFSATLTVTDNDGASSSTSVTTDVYAQAAGPYYGDVCSSVTVECFYAYGIIGSDHRVFLGGYDYSVAEWNRIFAGEISVVADSLAGTLLAEIYEPYVFLDGSQIGDVVVDANVEAQSRIIGSYSGIGDQGTAELFYNTPLDSPASLGKISGTWSWSDGLGYTDTMVVDGDGSFVSNDTDGCTLNGQFTLMDLTRNEYDIEYDLTCPPGVSLAGDGRRKGLALIDDFYETDTWLYWWITFEEGPMAGQTGLSSMSRPRAAAAIATGVWKPDNVMKARPRSLK